MDVRVYDTGPDTADRYTIVVCHDETSAWYAMSDNAISPDGFNQCTLPHNNTGKEIRLVDCPKQVLIAIIRRMTDYTV